MSTKKLLVVLLVLMLVVLLHVPGNLVAQTSLDTALAHAFQFSGQQLAASVGSVAANRYPQKTDSSGKWVLVDASDWSSGFLPGMLWYMYERTGDPTWRTNALHWQVGQDSQKTRATTSDLGFMLWSSYGNAYRLTGDDAYRQVLLTAARTSASRYSAVVGAIKSKDGASTDFRVFMDNMINLELLFWAAKHGGDHAWYDMAVSHALKTRDNQVRADGSTFQVVNYNPQTGAVKAKETNQGYNADSTWSRGQAWAIYGFTMVYRETGDARFLDTARKASDYYLAHLPADQIPYWDFNAPNIPNEPRDSSAASAAAAGLLELSQIDPDPERKQTYFNGATAALAALASSAYLAEGTANQAILLHGTHKFRTGDYDQGLSWGDYYFLEALTRYGAITGTLPAAPSATATGSPSATRTATSTNSATATRTATGTGTATATRTATKTATPSRTLTPSRSPSPSRTPSMSQTPAATPTVTQTPTPSNTPSAGSGGRLYYALDGNQGGYIEAEKMTTRAGAFGVVADSSRSNGAYIQTPDGSGNDPAISYVNYEVDVVNGGAFNLFLLGTGPNGSSDSFTIAVDTGSATDIATGSSGAWVWKKASGTLNLTTGTHTLSVRVREDGAQLDKLYLSKSSTTPTGLGGAALVPLSR